MLDKHSPAELYAITQGPNKLRNIGFGKHKGMKFEDIPRDYLQWMLNKNEWDKDTMFTVRKILEGN
jgi:exodeoxyribonuclease X